MFLQYCLANIVLRSIVAIFWLYSGNILAIFWQYSGNIGSIVLPNGLSCFAILWQYTGNIPFYV
jgi:hypothetical protein